MTKKELAERIAAFIATQSDNDKDAWYMTSREGAQHFLGEFAKFLNVPFPIQPKD